jgi:hypothetical protein
MYLSEYYGQYPTFYKRHLKAIKGHDMYVCSAVNELYKCTQVAIDPLEKRAPLQDRTETSVQFDRASNP